MTDHGTTHDGDTESDHGGDHDIASITFDRGGYIVYERYNAEAWIQADADSVVDVTA